MRFPIGLLVFQLLIASLNAGAQTNVPPSIEQLKALRPACIDQAARHLGIAETQTVALRVAVARQLDADQLHHTRRDSDGRRLRFRHQKSGIGPARHCALHRLCISDPEPSAFFTEFGARSLNFELRVFIANADQFRLAKHELNMAVDDAFHKAGITIAFPQFDVHSIASLRHTGGG
jgi:small-conductance mechanosensitive channel